MTKNKLMTASLMIIASIAVAIVLHLTARVFIPFAIAIIFLFVFNPLVSALTRRFHFPKLLAIFSALSLFVGFSALVGFLLYSSVRSLIGRYQFYANRLQALTTSLIERYDVPEIISEYLFESAGFRDTLRVWLLTVSGNSISFIGGVVLVAIFLLFLLLEQGGFSRKLYRAFGSSKKFRATNIIKDIYLSTTKYVNTKIFISLLTAVIISVSYAIIGVDFPFVWAVLTFLFNFIPSIGSIIVVLLSILFSIIQFAPSWGPVIAVALISTGIQFTIGNVIEPRLVGRSLNLSTVFIILSLLIWATIWGISGMFLAVPMTVIIKILLHNIPMTHPIAVLMEAASRSKDKDADNKPQQ